MYFITYNFITSDDDDTTFEDSKMDTNSDDTSLNSNHQWQQRFEYAERVGYEF